jgi:putative ABC transport system substrate-binding protein
MEPRSVKRREFLHVLAAAAMAAASPARAASAHEDLPLVIFLDDSEAPQAERLLLFRQSLALSGLPPQRLTLEIAEMPGSDARALRRALATCVKRDPTAFVTASADIATNGLAFMARIPLVFSTQVDPVKLGMDSAAGGARRNVTGFSYDVPIDMKAFEVLADAFPQARRVALVADRNWMEYHRANLDIAQIRERFGITIDLVIPAAPRSVEWEFERLLPARADACYVPNSDVTFFSAPALIAFLQRHRIPNLFASERALQLGALLSYGVRRDSHWEPMATMLRHILSGAQASDMPFERAREFVLGVNVAQAVKMGLRIPKHILRRANLVI